MLKKVLVVLVVLVVAFAAFVATRPSTFEVSRSETIAAPAEVVFAQLNDFKKWSAWSPWEKREPTVTKTYSGAESGVGAKYAWKGQETGSGTMEITESKPSERLLIDLQFTEPMTAKNQTEFKLSPQGDKVLLTWAMRGENNFMGKAFSLFVDMDKMLGQDFSDGLSTIKAISEGEALRRAAEAEAAAAVQEAGEGAADGAAPAAN